MFIGYPTRRHEVPLRTIIPNLLTTLGLCSGLASIHFALRADWDRALAAVVIAAVFDALDGRAARVLRTTSTFGAVLDSLADFLSFGVAPAMILHQWMLKDAVVLGRDADALGLAAVMTFVLCSALRLARFTAATKVAGKGVGDGPRVPITNEPLATARGTPSAASKFFVGMPTPAAAGAVLLPTMVEASSTLGVRTPAWLVIVYTFAIAGLMISRQPMFSFKGIRVRRRLVVPLLVVVGLVVVMAAKDPWLTGALLSGAYLLTLPLSISAYHRLVGESHAPPGDKSGPAPPTQEKLPLVTGVQA